LVLSFPSQIGEAFVGTGPNAAHVNTVLGARGGPVETAWATALATPRFGHVPFVVVLQPGLAVKPATLFVNKAPLAGEDHERLTWGAAQAGVAAGVTDAVLGRIIDEDALDELVLVVAVWVAPDAADDDAVFTNNRAATSRALAAGASHRPSFGELAVVIDEPWNPFFRAR
jgi:5,6,7,8-tetrahydromethanopterin hydro-lyase